VRIYASITVPNLSKNRIYELLNEAISMVKPQLSNIVRWYTRSQDSTPAAPKRTHCENLFLRLDKREVLRLLTRAFTPGRLDETLESLRRSIERYRAESGAYATA